MNWLLLTVALYFSLKKKWGYVFFIGLLADLMSGRRLGFGAFIFLMVGGLTNALKEYLPFKLSRQLKLKLE